MLLLTADHVYVEKQFLADGAVLIGDDGRIVAVGATVDVVSQPGAGDATRHDLRRHALIPGCFNSHTHSFQVLLRGNGDNARDFRDWVDGHLYPLVERLDERAIAAAALLAYAEMALAGTTTVGEFFYVHHGRDGSGGGNRHAIAVIEAARRLGIRIALLRTMYDLGTKPGQARFRESVSDASANTRALRDQFFGDDTVVVRPAPHSLHGASEAMIRAAAEIAAETGAPFHIHLAEQQGDLPFAMEKYGASPLRALDRMGALSELTTLVHGIWLDEDERQLLADRGGALVYNPLTNMALGDGVAHIPDLLRRGVPIGLGTDANNRLNMFDEMRAVEYLQRVVALEMGIVAGVSPESRGSAMPLFEMGSACGARALGIASGTLAPGMWADVVAISLDDPSLWPAAFSGGDDLLNAMVFSMVAQTAVRHSWVAGRPLVVDGRLANLTLDEIREELVAALG